MPLDRSALAATLADAFARREDPTRPVGADLTGVARVADTVAALGVVSDDARLVELVGRRVGADVGDGRFLPPWLPGHPSVAVVRESDLAVLRVSWRHATVDAQVLRPATDAAPGTAAMLVELPSQHVMERAFRVSNLIGPPKPGDPEIPSVPVPVRAARPSRLAFTLPVGERVPLTAAGVLAAMRRLPLRVSLQARPRSDPWLPPWWLGDLVEVLQPAALARLDVGEIAGRHLGVRRALAGLGGVAAIAADAGASAPLDRLRQVASRVVDARADRPGLGAFRPFEPGFDLVDVLAQIPTAPADDETALELPTRLVLSPSHLGGWAHADAPVVAPDGTVELWHTRLGTRIVADDGGVTVDEDNPAQRIVRAVWTRDVADGEAWPTDPTVTEWERVDGPGHLSTDKNPYRSSLKASWRAQIVQNTLRRERASRTAPPVEADALSLSPLGAWTDLHGHWNPDHGRVVAWDHRMAGGRDDFVRVVERGYFAPFGFRAVFVTETWREVGPATGSRGPAAVLRQRTYPLFQETVRRFTGATTRENPFTEVRVLQVRGPDVEDAPPGAASFVPQIVPGTAWAVPVVAVDADGVEHAFPVPMLFVFVDDAVAPASTPLPDAVLTPFGAQATNGGFSLVAPTIPVDVTARPGGRRIAYAPRSAVGDMAHGTDTLRFAARLRVRDCDPVLVRAEVVVPAVAALTGRREPVAVTYHPGYRAKGFEAGEVVLALTDVSTKPPPGLAKPRIVLPGGTASSGGLAAPSLDLGGLSRSLGVVGDAAAPADLDALLSGARLFGIVPLADLLPHDLATAPKIVQQVLDGIGAVSHDLHRLVDLGVAPAADALDALTAAAVGTVDADEAFAKVQTASTAARGLAGATTPGLAALLQRIADGVDTVLPAASDLAALLALLRAGTLPDPSHLRLHLTIATTTLGWWPPTAAQADAVVDGGQLLISVDVRGDGAGAPSTEVVAEIRGMTIRLVPGSDLTHLVDLPVERLLVRMRAGSKPEVDVVLGAPQWRGVLSWVSGLLDLLPPDGFADPPYVEVDSAGARAGFSLALPDLAMGMVCLTNLAVAAEARVPWVGDGPSLWFAFCRRDRPFTLAVSFLGGGGYFGVEIGTTGVRSLEAAFEIGAVLALDFGVASGSVSCMAGIYFKLSGSNGTILGYLRIRGEVEVLGLISASITLAMELGYDAGKVVGRASISVAVSVAFFSTSVSIACEKKFAGSAGDPTFAELLGPADGPWAQYCAAFAPRGGI